jgi:hypothetical protein
MPSIILEYTAPAPWKFEWRYLRISLGVFLFVLGWFCFSSYVWHCFGRVWTGGKPSLRLARDLCLPKIVAVTLVMTGLNFAYLNCSLKARKQPFAAWLVYSSLALLPIAALAANEFFFGDFIVE